MYVLHGVHTAEKLPRCYGNPNFIQSRIANLSRAYPSRTRMWTTWRDHLTSLNFVNITNVSWWGEKTKLAETTESFDRLLENVVMACKEFGARFEKNSACSLSEKDEENEVAEVSGGSDTQSSSSSYSEYSE